jgi:hypothetical protein
MPTTSQPSPMRWEPCAARTTRLPGARYLVRLTRPLNVSNTQTTRTFRPLRRGSRHPASPDRAALARGSAIPARGPWSHRRGDRLARRLISLRLGRSHIGYERATRGDSGCSVTGAARGSIRTKASPACPLVGSRSSHPCAVIRAANIDRPTCRSTGRTLWLHRRLPMPAQAPRTTRSEIAGRSAPSAPAPCGHDRYWTRQELGAPTAYVLLGYPASRIDPRRHLRTVRMRRTR